MNENKLASMDAVGELPDFGNLLLRESGYPHLPNNRYTMAGSTPKYPTLCEVKILGLKGSFFSYWNGDFWGMACGYKHEAIDYKETEENTLNIVMWREVQP